MSMPPKAYYSDTNGVPKAAGRVTHLGLAVGELSQRVVSVGSLSRAKRLVASLDKPAEAFELTSDPRLHDIHRLVWRRARQHRRDRHGSADDGLSRA